MRPAHRLWLLLILPAILSASPPGRAEGTVRAQVTITVDASTPWLGRFPVRVTFPARAGRLTLVYPNWIPGMHAAQGPIRNVARLKLSVDGKPLTWRRDPYDVYIIHTAVPEGEQTVEAAYDYVSPPRPSFDDCVYGAAASHNLAILNPSAFALAPADDPRRCTVVFRVRLPHGWTAATALLPASPETPDPDTVEFASASLYTVIDSPIIIGAYHKSVHLATPPGDVPHTLEIFADAPDALQKEATFTPPVTRLVAESGRMFAARHYRAFHFLLALTTAFGPSALEHHACSLYVVSPTSLDPGKSDAWDQNLIPHEYVHSWCGKYRRPYGEDPQNGRQPQSTDMMWIYEGLTEYLGELLMVRAGFRSVDEWRADLTDNILDLRKGPGRDWESLDDAAIMASHTYVFQNGMGLRPIDDIYYEGRLVWLEADMIIRRESGGRRSLDDFCRLFFGGQNRGAEVRAYRRQDIVAALYRTQPHDWDAFLRDRVDGAPAGLPTSGIEAAGWRLTYADQLPPGRTMNYRHFDQMLDVSVGMSLIPQQNTITVYSVVPGSPAERASIKVGMAVTAVNGIPFAKPITIKQSTTLLLDALTATKDKKRPLEFTITEEGKQHTIAIGGLNGAHFPVLTRSPDLPDLLTEACQPLTHPTSIK